MRGIFDRTPVSPTVSSSGSAIYRQTTGKRPLESVCDTLDACPTCPADRSFKFPVVPGDLVYLQFRFADHYNDNPQVPTIGWYTGPSDDFWLEAFLEFGTLDDLALPHGNIVSSASVGWAQGSVQNLFLNSNAINGYAVINGAENECFRVRVNTYKWAYESALTVISIGTLPDASDSRNGLYAISGSDIYITEDGEWVFDHTAEDGELVFNMASGQYHRYDADGGGKLWPISERERERELYQTCYSYWHKLVDSCTETVLFNGIFVTNDCAGHYYGAFGSALPFQDYYRLEGSFEMNAIVTEKETNENGVITSLKQLENWLFRNHVGLPEGVIRRLANTLEAENLFIDSNKYINASDITKINEAGEYWYVAPTAQRLVCERENSCNDDFAFNPIVNCPPFAECPDPGSPVRVHNSDDTFDEEVASGGTLLLEDYQVEVFLDGVSVATDSFPAMIDQTINITWN